MKLNVLLLFLFTTFNDFSQSIETLKLETKKLYEANYLMEFETIANLTYPKVMELLDREVFIEKLDSLYQNDIYRLRLQLPTNTFQYSPLKNQEGKSFCVITFKNPVRYFFEKKLTNEQVSEQKKHLQEINQTQEVTFEPARNSFNVKKITTYIAVSDVYTSGKWKFFNFDNKDQRDFFEKEFQSFLHDLKTN